MVDRPYQPIFVLGTGRCGSTLIHEVLARHEATAWVSNLDDLGVMKSTRFQQQTWRNLPPAVTRKGGARFAPSEGYRVVAREVGPVVVDPLRDLRARDATPWLRQRMRAFVDARAQRVGAPVFLHKFTGWPRSGFLTACFPDAKFIEVVRDGRAVANSWLQMSWWRGHLGPASWHFGGLSQDLDCIWRDSDRSFPVLAALAWRLLMDSYDEARSNTQSDRWLTIRYEDLTLRPTECVAELLDFMRCDWTSNFDAAFARYTFSPSRSDAFRRDLDPSDVTAMEVAIGATLARNGYL